MLPQNKPYDRIVLFFIKKAAVCICGSDFVLTEYSTLGVNNVMLLKNPINNEINFKAPRQDMNKLNVAFVGSVIEIKGVNYLLDIFNYEFVEDIVVHIFGDGNQLNLLKEIYSGQNKIIFHGFVDNIMNYMDQMIDVLVVTTIIPEAGPTIIQLGLSRGLPIITTNIGAQKTFVLNGHNGILVDPKNSLQIAKAIMSFKDNKEMYNRFSFNATVSAQEFETIKTFNDKLLNIINSLH
jgi:glycosyltransferase involved in cell wall biosynthesis